MAKKKSNRISVTPGDISWRLNCASAGDRLQLKSGTYSDPIVIEGRCGTADNPIYIEPHPKNLKAPVTITSGLDDKKIRDRANLLADRRQRAGNYPSVSQNSNQAVLVLRHCQYVIIRGLNFKDCWIAGIHIERCQHIVVDDVSFRGGTVAISANGIETSDITVQNCSWQQDMSKRHEMWNGVPWGRIHGSKDNSKYPGVDLKNDYRHWDGDFFIATDIAGNVTIRNNKIRDAFNAIHFFNSVDALPPGVVADSLKFNSGRRSAANVLIENNIFIRIRDNIFEPEDHAWNWVIRRNRFHDCYRPFSLEFDRAGWIYIYGNMGSFLTRPSRQLAEFDPEPEKFPSSEHRKTPSLFKPKGKQANEGPIFVFNNSWHMKSGKGLLPKFALGSFVHVNNVADFGNLEKANVFGNNGKIPGPAPWDTELQMAAERRRFTRRWDKYQIQMNGDVVADLAFPDIYRQFGYQLGAQSKFGTDNFTEPEAKPKKSPDFTLKAKSKAKRASLPFQLSLPDGESLILPMTADTKTAYQFDCGAVQAEKTWKRLDKLFRFLPDTGWFDDLKLKQENTAHVDLVWKTERLNSKDFPKRPKSSSAKLA